jgi:hypothetical protein
MFILCCPLFYAILQRGCCRNFIYGRRKCSSVAFRVVCGTRSVTAEQKEVERVAMSEAISAFCQAFGLDGVPSGSSPQSHLRALGGHVRNRLRGVLHHGVRRAFAVLASHYDVDLKRVSEGYCLPDDEEAALAEVQRLDAAVEGPSAALASSFEVEVLPPVSPSEAVPDPAKGGNDAEGAAPPPAAD